MIQETHENEKAQPQVMIQDHSRKPWGYWKEWMRVVLKLNNICEEFGCFPEIGYIRKTHPGLYHSIYNYHGGFLRVKEKYLVEKGLEKKLSPSMPELSELPGAPNFTKHILGLNGIVLKIVGSTQFKDKNSIGERCLVLAGNEKIGEYKKFHPEEGDDNFMRIYTELMPFLFRTEGYKINLIYGKIKINEKSRWQRIDGYHEIPFP